MTQPKFPWALLVIIAMFTFVAIHPVSPPWIVAFAIFAVVVSASAAIYQVIPRKDDSLIEPADPDSVPDQWNGEDQPSS
jgi:hypothetical protein